MLAPNTRATDRVDLHARSSEHAQEPRARPPSAPRLSRQRLPCRLQPLPPPARTALTSTVGIGAASCSGVRLPNSSASTSIPLTVKEEVDRTSTSGPAAPSKRHAEAGVRRPKVSPRRLFTGGAAERFRLVPEPGSGLAGCRKRRLLVKFQGFAWLILDSPNWQVYCPFPKIIE